MTIFGIIAIFFLGIIGTVFSELKLKVSNTGTKSILKCPIGCNCEDFAILQCQAANLTKIPQQINPATRHLNLRANYIECLQSSTTTSLDAVESIDLSENLITGINAKWFEQFPNLQKLDLSANPLHCGCNMKPVMNLMINDIHFGELIEKSDGICRTGLVNQRFTRALDKSFSNCSLISNNYDACFVSTSTPNTPRRTIREVVSSCDSQYCSCSKDFKVKCESLSSVPQDLPQNIIELDLSNNLLKNLSADAFIKYPLLRKLSLSNNSIEAVHVDSFNGLNDLRTLFLNSNRIRTFPIGTFSRLNKLISLFLQGNRLSCLHVDMFNGLGNVTILHLAENKIQNIPEGTFDHTPKLRFLYMGKNPLNCNCRLKWLTRYLLLKEASSEQLLARCHQPLELKGQILKKLDENHLSCNNFNYQNDEAANAWNGCLAAKFSQCPTECTCREMTSPNKDANFENLEEIYGPSFEVNCDQKNLTSIPESLPLMTRILNLSNNKIRDLSPGSVLAELRILEALDLSHNKLTKIDIESLQYNTELKRLDLNENQIIDVSNGFLDKLHKLEVLSLQGNKIFCLPDQSFQANVNLQTLLLHNNLLRHISEKALNKLNLQLISLDENPLECSCNLVWLPDWLRKHRSILQPSSQAIICIEPDKFSGTPLLGINTTDFDCSTCISKLPQCDKKITCPRHPSNIKCPENFCQNSGQCIFNINNDGKVVFECRCEKPYFGLKCEQKSLSCSKGNPCKNFAECLEQDGLISCQCTPGFFGTFCEKIVKNCHETNPCKNGGSCQSNFEGNYNCICPIGFSGKHCETNKNDCLYNLCQNGGQCIDGINNYICKCRPGYFGALCESLISELEGSDFVSGELVHLPKEEPHSCKYNRCLNGGKCIPKPHLNSYECLCNSGFIGRFCESLMSATIATEMSYIAVRIPSEGALIPWGNLSIVFNANSPDGLLLHHNADSKSPQLIVQLKRGFLHVKYSSNSNSTRWNVQLISFKKVNDNSDHFLEVALLGSDLSARLDGSLLSQHDFRGRFRYVRSFVNQNNTIKEDHVWRLNNLDEKNTLYVGGGPSTDLLSLYDAAHIVKPSGIGTSCISNLRVNNKLIDLARISGVVISRPQAPEFDLLAQRHFGSAIGVSPGCNAQTKLLISSEASSAIRPKQFQRSSDILNYISNSQSCPSELDKCVNGGTCQWKPSGHTFCTCTPGFSGKFCENNGSCMLDIRMSTLRDPESGCNSRRKIRIRSCTGGCFLGENNLRTNRNVRWPLSSRMRSKRSSNETETKLSCQPVEYLTRDIEFVCNNGTIFKKSINLVKRCSCN